MNSLAASEIRWNLSSLYAGIEDPLLQDDLVAARSDAERFRHAFYGQINSSAITAVQLSNAALQQYEIVQSGGNSPGFLNGLAQLQSHQLI